MVAAPLSARRQAGLSGLAAAFLFGGGSAIWGLDMPDSGTPPAEILDFYRDTADRIVVGATMSMVAIAAFVWSAAALRTVLVEAGGDETLATTAFGGALLAAAVGIGAETINMSAALRVREDELSAGLAQTLFEIPQVLGSYAAGVGLAVFALAVAAVALQTRRVLPRWLAILLVVVGIAMLTPVARFNVVPGTVLVVLTTLIAVTLLRRPIG